MNILVTGGTGFVGSALIFRLLQEKYRVRSLDFQQGLFYDELKKAGAELVSGSITRADLIEKCMEGVDVVFHLAAAFRQRNAPNKQYYDVNVNGTRNVMKSAKKHGVLRVIYCSTQGVHGNLDKPPGDENSPIAPDDFYEQTKYEGELVVREFIQEGMNAVILRSTSVYGPGDPGRFLMIYKLVNKGFFPMFGGGRTLNHPVYIHNLIDAFLLVLNPERGKGETYLIGDEEYLSIKELVLKVGGAMGVSVRMLHFPILPLVAIGHICEKVCKPLQLDPPIFPRRVDWYRKVRAFRIDKAKRELGYRPKVDLYEGLKRTGKWYTQEGYLS